MFQKECAELLVLHLLRIIGETTTTHRVFETNSSFIAYSGKSLISVFQGLFAGIGQGFILAGEFSTRLSMGFRHSPDIS